MVFFFRCPIFPFTFSDLATLHISYHATFIILQIAISCKISKAPGWAKDMEGDDCKSFVFDLSQRPDGRSCDFEVEYTYTVTNQNMGDTVEYIKQFVTEFTQERFPRNELPDEFELVTQERLSRQMTIRQSRTVEDACGDKRDYYVEAYVDATRGGQGIRCVDRDDYRFTPLGMVSPLAPPTPRPTPRPTPVPPSPTPRPPTPPTRCNWDVSDYPA